MRREEALIEFQGVKKRKGGGWGSWLATSSSLHPPAWVGLGVPQSVLVQSRHLSCEMSFQLQGSLLDDAEKQMQALKTSALEILSPAQGCLWDLEKEGAGIAAGNETSLIRSALREGCVVDGAGTWCFPDFLFLEAALISVFKNNLFPCAAPAGREPLQVRADWG